MNKKSYFLMCLFSLTVMLSAQNLINDSDFDKPLPHPEIHVTTYPGMSKQSIFTEDLSWNKCLKLEALKNPINPRTKKPYHFQRLFIGGDKGNGVKVKPNTTYNYSLELKGNVVVRVFIMEWSGKKSRKVNLTPLIKDLSVDEWKVVRGKFQTGADATKVAVCVNFVAYVANLLPQPGSYLLVDKVCLEEKTNILGTFDKQEDKSEKKLPLKRGVFPNQPVKGFVDYKKNIPVKADTQVTVVAEEKSLKIKVKCFEPEMSRLKASVSKDGSNDIWKDDSIEIFFAPVKKDRSFSQFVIGAGGGRWMSYGFNHRIDKFDQWKAEVSKQNDSWTVNAEIPYTLLSWEKRPSEDTLIGFNVARNRKPLRETSAWNFPDGQFRNVNYFGALFLADKDAWFKATKVKLLAAARKSGDESFIAKINNWKDNSNPSTLINESGKFYDDLRLLKLKGRTFILTQVNPATDPTIPLLPENIVNPPDKITIRAAGNEFKPLPLAITNLTDNVEEYRIIINSFALDDFKEQNGLEGSSGTFPIENIKLYRGIRVRDGNGKGCGTRFDPLAPMDITQTLVVMPKQATPVWAIFNTAGVKPGKYKGIIRVIPLCETAQHYWAAKGKKPQMHDVPFEIEVLPFELDKKYAMAQSFCSRAFGNRKIFQQLMDFGCYSVSISAWQFIISFKPDGSVAKRDISSLVKEIRFYREQAEKNDIKDEFSLAFANVYKVFYDVRAQKRFKYGTPEWHRAWESFLNIIKDAVKEAGLDIKNCRIQVLNEPKPETAEESIAALKVTRETLPGAKIAVAFAPWQMQPEQLEKFIPYVDIWNFWDTKYFVPKYAPLLKKLREKNKIISFYRCETSMRQHLQKYYRSHAWTALAYKLDIAGMYIYLDNLYYMKDWRQAPFGAFALVARDTPITTIRMECLRIGQNDLRYFKKLKDMFNSAKIKSPQLRKEISDFLKTAPALLGIQETFDANLAEATREKMIDYILRLQNQ